MQSHTKDSIAATFGRRLRSLRRQRGLTQEALARRVDLDPKHVGGLERGEHGSSFDAVEKIARALGVDFFELFLPDRLATGPLELAAAAASDNLTHVTPAALEQFFQDLLAALQRLEASGPRRTASGASRRRG